MHPQYKAIYDAIVTEVNRPDRVKEIHAAITSAAKELHGLREWPRDTKVAKVKLLRPATVIEVPLSKLENFASLKRVSSECGLTPTVHYKGNAIEFVFSHHVVSVKVEFVQLPEITPTQPSWVFGPVGERLLLATALRNFHTTMNNERAAAAKRAEIGVLGDPQSLVFSFLRRASNG